MKGSMSLYLKFKALAQKAAANVIVYASSQRWEKNAPILVYQMGKVGSTSVYKSLKKIMPYGAVFFVHFLSDDVARYKKVHIDAGVFPVPYHIEIGIALREMIKKSSSNIRYKIVSMVRDPIARQISDVFQNPKLLKENITKNDGTFDLYKCFNYVNKMLSKQSSFNYVFNWFDNELKRVFGIDVFSVPFDKATGWKIYHGEKADVLVMRLENLSIQGEDAIKTFLDIPKIELIKANIRSNTKDASVYNHLKRTVKIDRSICDYVYSSRFVKHFYSESEIDDMKKRWSSEI